MLSKKKKIFVLVGMVALLVLTGTLNIFLNNNGKQPVEGGEIYQSLFDTCRADRRLNRADTIAYLTAIIESEASSAEAKTNAEATRQMLASAGLIEDALETQIVSSGFDDVFVTCSTKNVNIIINQESLTQEEADRILAIVLRETDREATEVVVTPIK